jgi:hypothetical protein
VPLILNLGTRRGEWFASRSGRFTPAKKSGSHLIGSWVPSPMAGINFLEMKKSLAPTGIRNPERKHVAQSLYRLC